MPIKNKPNFRPRKYLSWSQLWLWENDPEQYIRQYIYGEKIEPNEAMLLGKKLADCLDSRDAQGDPAMEHLLTFMQASQHTEFKLSADCEGVPLYGRLDGYTEAEIRIIDEVKSGKNWTQKKVDEFGQLTFYGLMVHLRFKVKPEEIKFRLHWAKTENTEDGLCLTGDIKTFETKRTMKDLAIMASRIQKAWKGITEASVAAAKEAGL